MKLSTVLCLLTGDPSLHSRAINALSAEPGLDVRTFEGKPARRPLPGGFERLPWLIKACVKHRPLALLVADTKSAHAAAFTAWLCGVPVSFPAEEGGRVAGLGERLQSVSRQAGLPLIIKRAFDVFAASCALTILSPLTLGTALALRFSVGSPVLFRQERPGKHARIFRIYKFRTMTSEHGPDGRLLPDAQRLTRVGRFVRRASLDELPQLWNVLRGEMSLVGPRPLLTQYLERYSPDQVRRHNVLPGITGLAQVNGRNQTTWAARLDLDTRYVDSWSIRLDAQVLLSTLRTVLRREGISQPGHATMPEFTGV